MTKMLDRDNMHNYQNAGIEHIIKNKFCGLFLDMGLGKTVTTLTAIKILEYEDLDINSTLIVAPKRVAENVWTSEIEKWKHLSSFKISRIIGTEKQRRKALAEKADIHIISRDNLVWLCGQFGGSMLPWEMLVIDESSSFKNPKSLRFKALKQVLKCFKRIALLTGTPAPNGLIDLWAQIYILDQGERLGKYIGHYRDDYFKPGKRNGAIIYKYDIKKECSEQIYAKISDICMSMKAEDYLDLKERINNYIEIVLPPAIQKKYNDFEEEQVLLLFEDMQAKDSTISAVNAAALSNKLLQFANGAIYDDEHNWHEVHDLKLVEVENIIEEACGRPVLIARTYQHDLTRLMKKLKKYNPRELKTEQDIFDWNAGKIQVLIMHPASGGHGLNLQAGGNIIVWFGQTWSLELYMQLNARLDRQGQKEQVIIHHLTVKGTIDQDVVQALERKSQSQEGLMQAIKSRLKKYTKFK